MTKDNTIIRSARWGKTCYIDKALQELLDQGKTVWKITPEGTFKFMKRGSLTLVKNIGIERAPSTKLSKEQMQYWYDIGKRWSKAFDKGKSVKEFLDDNPDINYSVEYVRDRLRKLGYKIRRKGRRFT